MNPFSVFSSDRSRRGPSPSFGMPWMPWLRLGLMVGLGVSVSTVHAQNQAPVVSNVTTTLDPGAGWVEIRYDVADAEGDSVEIWLRISPDGGTTFQYPRDSVTGDVGFPIAPGTQKLLVWDYAALPPSGSYVAMVIASDRAAIDIQTIVDQVDSSRIVADLTALEGVRHYDAAPLHMAATKDYIEGEFLAKGLQVTRHPFTFGAWNAENVIGRHPGLLRDDQTYIVDGHFDTVTTTPGADDNGSAVAGVLEAMRVLSQYAMRRSVSFIGFDLEEVGIIGSREYVLTGLPSWQVTRGVINFEMIGYTCTTPGCDVITGNGTAIYNVADPNSTMFRNDFTSAASQYVPGLTVLPATVDPNDPAFRRSDHFRFWDVGIPALFINDGGNNRNPNYHQSTDLIGTLDIPFLTNVVKAAVATIAENGLLLHAGKAVSAPFDFDAVSVGSLATGPRILELLPNHPNPFRPATTIRYALGREVDATIRILDARGREVRVFRRGTQSAGEHRVRWDGRDESGNETAAGVYFVRLVGGGIVDTQKMTRLR